MHPWRTNPNRAWPERKWQRCVTSDNSPVTLYSIRLEIFFPFASQQREKIIFDHFSDSAFINQFIEFLSLEDRKGKDKFSPRRFCLFKVRFVGVGVLKQKMLQVEKILLFIRSSRDCSVTSTTPLFLCCNRTWSAWWPTHMRASNVVCQRSSLDWLEGASIGAT